MSDRRTRARFCSSRLLAFACFALFSAACDAPAPVSRLAGTAEYALIVGANEPQVVRDAVADLRRYLEEMGATSVSLITVPAEASYRWSELEDAATKGVIVVYGDWLVDSSVDAATRTSLVGDSFVIKGRSAAGRTKILVELFAPSSRPRIYSVYDLVQRLGVRFFHPEEEYIPDTLTFPTPPFEHVERPTFKWRGFHLHLTHPLELLDEFSSDDPASVKRARNFIRWLIKLKQNYSSGTSGTAAINAWKKELGLVVGSGLGLTNIQQGGRPLLVPTDPLEVNLSKIEGRLEQIFADPQNLPDFFGVSASDTEIFNSDATKDQILQWFTFATEWVHTRYPEVYLLQNVHITKEEVIPDLGVDVNLVHTLLPPYVNLQIHTVMFYGLHGPAPAYGHETFEDRFALFESELKKGRRMWYFPESAWWLTFDNAVPLFLPIYLKMRWLDLKDLEPMIPQGIDGHLTFTSGHEWGYWITDYCVAQMTWSNSLDWTACLAQITDPMGPSGAEVHNVLVEMGDYQQETLIDRDMHRWLVGEDDLAEVGAKTPKAAHRIRVPFSDLETWTLEQLNAFRSAELADMLEMEQTYGAYLERLRAVAATIRPRAEHLFAEIFDGTEIDYLRARQIRLLYEGLLDAREALLKGDTALLTTARTKLGLAKEVTVDAAKVVTRREALYRYPLRLSSEGSRDHPVPNRTSYPFRVHSDTHVLFFWHRRDKKAQETLDKLEHSLVTISDVLSERSQAVEVLVSPLVASDSRIVFGDGTEEPSGPSVSHRYSDEGIYDLSVKKGDETLVATSVAVVTKRRRFRMRTLEITKPAEAGSTALLLRGLLPDIFVGTGSVNALAHDADHNGAPDAGTVVPLIANGDGTFQPIDWTAQLLGRTITFYDMSLSLDLSGAVPVLRFSGKLERSQLSLFIISLGGIDQFSVDGILNTIFLDPIEEPGRTLYPIEAELTGE